MPGIHFECPKCSQPIDAAGELASQLIECPICKETIEVPIRSRQATPPVPTLPQPPPIASGEYAVVPFVAVVAHGKGSEAAATQLQQMIHSYARNGWEYVRLESVETYIEGDNGCFGIGATPPRTTVYSMAVFKR
jgi:hypothetical protein